MTLAFIQEEEDQKLAVALFQEDQDRKLNVALTQEDQDRLLALRCEIFFFSSRSFKMREKCTSFAQFVYFLREVCLLSIFE